ncbi:MAG: hypothetical protein HY547_08780 [Elusimicrobia bacterium]|nr:hypothetical protein [Elusimicrobiota bacterium]
MSPTKINYIECPDCHAMLEVDVSGGKILHHWKGTDANKPALERFDDALRKIDDDKKKRSQFFSSAADELEKKRRKAEDLFGQGLKKIKKEGLGEPPRNPFDLD